MKDHGPNWGLAFGSGSFLIVWCLGFLSGVAVEVIALRACVATILGSIVGLMVTQVLMGLRQLRDETSKGSQVDFTLPAGDDEVSLSATEATATVPQAPAAPAVEEGFQPLDFKQAARHVQATMKE